MKCCKGEGAWACKLTCGLDAAFVPPTEDEAPRVEVAPPPFEVIPELDESGNPRLLLKWRF